MFQSVGAALEQERSSLIHDETYPFNEKLVRDGILPQWGLQKEVVSQDQEGLHPGFLLGQLSIALIIFFFIKFFIFGELPSADDRALHLSSLRRARTLAHQNTLHQRTRSNSTTNPLRPKSSRNVIREAVGAAGGPSVGAILAKTYYNVKGHQPESLDWFNVLIAQTIAQLRADARQDGAVLTSLTELLNTGSKPDWIGEIKVTEIALGDEFPIFSNCRVMPAEEGFLSGGGSGGISGTEEGRLQARMDVDLSDIITLGIETTLVLNYPKPLVAVLPVALAVSVVRFSGTLAVSFIPSSSPPSTSTSTPAPEDSPRPQSSNGNTPRRPTTLAFTFLDDYRLDLSVRSLVGSRSRLQDVPKIAQLIESRVHAWFDERAVEPRFQQIVLPSLWPRKKNTRGGEEGEHDSDDEGIDVTSPPESSVLSSISEGGAGPAGARTRPSSFAPDSLEARIEAEGAKLREAEIRAGERSRSRGDPADGMRWRGDHLHEQDRPTNRLSREWSGTGQTGMPGAMPGG
ncbi:ERMES complex subunit mmm1 [Kalmusia sp. IMI 367209]|nr:ERMES complex subunit mmm1 [Kalmusia sp. IMI 367209]